MVFFLSDAFNFIKDSLKYVVTAAPYPIRMAFWIVIFMSVASFLSLMVSFGTVCTSDEVAHQMDTPLLTLRANFKNFELANTINFTLYNLTDNTSIDLDDFELSWWEETILAGTGLLSGQFIVYEDDAGNIVLTTEEENITGVIEYSAIVDAIEYVKYDDFIENNSAVIPISDNELVYMGCDGVKSKMYIAGIDFTNKTLWLVLMILAILAPFIKMALDRK